MRHYAAVRGLKNKYFDGARIDCAAFGIIICNKTHKKSGDFTSECCANISKHLSIVKYNPMG